MTRKTLIIALFSLVYVFATAGVLYFVIRSVSYAGLELAERIETIANKNVRARAYNDFVSLVQSTEVERDSLSSFVLIEDQASSFLTDIEALGVSQGVQITTNALKVNKQTGSFNELLIQFNIKGPEKNVQNMLVLFETLPYHSRVASITFSRKEGSETESNIELGVSIPKKDEKK